MFQGVQDGAFESYDRLAKALQEFQDDWLAKRWRRAGPLRHRARALASERFIFEG